LKDNPKGKEKAEKSSNILRAKGISVSLGLENISYDLKAYTAKVFNFNK